MLEDLSYDRERFFMGEGLVNNSGLGSGVGQALDIFLADADLLRGLDKAGG